MKLITDRNVKEFGMISIIMAAYNAEQTICLAIDSVMTQTYQNWELLVINDCSTDKTGLITQEYCRKDNRIICINNSENQGVSVSRRKGLKLAKGEWIAILDSDDAWEKDKLEKQIKCQIRTNGDIIYTGSAFMDSEGKRLNGILEVPDHVSYNELLKQNIISNSSSMVRKNVLEQHYSVGDNMHEDFANWLKILKGGYKAYGVQEPLLIYRINKDSKTGRKLKSAFMNWNTYRYVGLNIGQCIWYMAAYSVNGIRKYSNLNKKRK